MPIALILFLLVSYSQIQVKAEAISCPKGIPLDLESQGFDIKNESTVIKTIKFDMKAFLSSDKIALEKLKKSGELNLIQLEIDKIFAPVVALKEYLPKYKALRSKFWDASAEYEDQLPSRSNKFKTNPNLSRNARALDQMKDDLRKMKAELAKKIEAVRSSDFQCLHSYEHPFRYRLCEVMNCPDTNELAMQIGALDELAMQIGALDENNSHASSSRRLFREKEKLSNRRNTEKECKDVEDLSYRYEKLEEKYSISEVTKIKEPFSEVEGSKDFFDEMSRQIRLFTLETDTLKQVKSPNGNIAWILFRDGAMQGAVTFRKDHMGSELIQSFYPMNSSCNLAVSSVTRTIENDPPRYSANLAVDRGSCEVILRNKDVTKVWAFNHKGGPWNYSAECLEQGGAFSTKNSYPICSCPVSNSKINPYLNTCLTNGRFISPSEKFRLEVKKASNEQIADSLGGAKKDEFLKVCNEHFPTKESSNSLSPNQNRALQNR